MTWFEGWLDSTPVFSVAAVEDSDTAAANDSHHDDSSDGDGTSAFWVNFNKLVKVSE